MGRPSWVYLAIGLLTAVPVRLLFRMRDKENLVRVSNRLAIAGLLVLSLSLSGAILMVADVLFKSPAPALFTGGFGLILAVLWIVLPVIRRLKLAEADTH